MKLLDFNKTYGTEAICKAAFKLLRESGGVTCRRCQGGDHYWLSTLDPYKCKKCGSHQSLKSGTLLEYSKLPHQYWFIAMHLISATKKGFSSLEMQRQIGHKRYEPIWAMMHKIRSVMGKRDEKYQLEGLVEADESFFEVAFPEGKETKPGRGSKQKEEVLAIASTELLPPARHKKGRPRTRCKFINMKTLVDLKTPTIEEKLEEKTSPNSDLITDDADGYNYAFLDYKSHTIVEGTAKEKTKQLPWVHISIANAKRKLLDIHHCISEQCLQRYLDEFCYK
jgi:DNA-directed RNA polymerase subunit RPC12/RpoP